MFISNSPDSTTIHHVCRCLLNIPLKLYCFIVCEDSFGGGGGIISLNVLFFLFVFSLHLYKKCFKNMTFCVENALLVKFILLFCPTFNLTIFIFVFGAMTCRKPVSCREPTRSLCRSFSSLFLVIVCVEVRV